MSQLPGMPSFSYGTSQGQSQNTGMSQSQGTSNSIGAGQSTSQSGTGMVAGMENVYSQLLGINQGHYNNVLSAYHGGASNLASSLPSIYAGYSGLGNTIQNTLGMGQVLGQNGNWGVATPAAQAIQQAYGQQMGNTTQQMTNAGLGNTTAVANAQQQNAAGAAQAYGSLGAQLAQTAAGYESQIGQAGLSGQMQGLGMQTGLVSSALNPLGSQFSNTAGSLTGSYGTSQSTNINQAQSLQNAYSQQQGTSNQNSMNYSQGAIPGYSLPSDYGVGYDQSNPYGPSAAGTGQDVGGAVLDGMGGMGEDVMGGGVGAAMQGDPNFQMGAGMNLGGQIQGGFFNPNGQWAGGV